MLLATSSVSGSECQVAKHAQLPQDKDIIFFASWCSSCLVKIKESDPGKTLYVAVFDEKESAQKALDFGLKGKASGSCLLDKSDSIAKEYGLFSLPHKTIRAKAILKKSKA